MWGASRSSIHGQALACRNTIISVILHYRYAVYSHVRYPYAGMDRPATPAHSEDVEGSELSRNGHRGVPPSPHHSGDDRKEERDHQQPEDIADDHPPRRENAKIIGQSTCPHDAPRKAIPGSNAPRGASFPQFLSALCCRSRLA